MFIHKVYPTIIHITFLNRPAVITGRSAFLSSILFQTVFCWLLRVSGTVQIYARYHNAACAGQNLVDDPQRHEPYGDCRKYQHADNQI